MSNTRFAYTNKLDSATTLLLNGPAVVTGVINQWTNGSASVTRASGSYVTDGVKRWSLVSGNLAAKFPASTRVQVVAATTLTMTATATAGGSGTDSGTFTPDQPLSELAAYLTSNAQNGERYIPYFSAVGPASPIILEYDLGAAEDVTTAALLNSPTLPAGTLISSVEVEYASTYPTWSAVTSWSPAGGPDSGKVFTLQNKRFWRFKLVNTGQFQVGRLWAGIVQSDMGGLYSPGTIKSTGKNRRRERSPVGVQQSFYNGRALHSWRYRFGKATDAMLALLDSVIQQQKSILLITEADLFYEVEAADSLDWSIVFLNVQDVESVVFEELY